MNDNRPFSESGLKLPNEILEIIFAQVPLGDLLTTYTLVCKSWSEVILNPYFLPWKKLYLSVKLERKGLISAALLGPSRRQESISIKDFLSEFIEKYDLGNLQNFLLKAINFMGKVHCVPESFQNCCERLKRHRLFTSAHECLLWIPHTHIPRPFTVWHVTATIIIISENVWDVYRLLRLLLTPPSNFTATDVVEAFYSLATLFLQASRTLDLPIRYHYIVYYAIYLFENSWQPVGNIINEGALSQHSGQQPITRFITIRKQLTHEQAKIVNHDIQKSHVVKIVAFAGTGKTTTLLNFCKERPGMRFLLVVYNKSVQVSCSSSFPTNTAVKTAHAMAFGYVGRKYSAIGKLSGNINAMKILDILEEKANPGNRFKRAGLVKLTLEKFFNSVDRFVTLRHVPTVDRNGVRLEDDYRLHVILDDAETAWKEMTRCSKQQRLNMSQDGQLKEWQLLSPKLRGYDVIMIDEGQDMNPAMFDIFLNQDSAKVIVGDPFQQIYAFRGATNAIQSLDATHTFYLTQSFRFGPEIGFIGHCLLEKLLNVSKETLIGGSKEDTILINPNAEVDGMQKAFLCRTNLSLYKLCLRICKNSNSKNKGIAVVGGLDKFGLDDVIDIWKLSQVSQGFGTAKILEIKNKFIARFSNVNTLMNYAENVEDMDLLSKIQMYRYSGQNTLADVNQIRKRCDCEIKMADIVFSTIHKAKGLEWDWVILADDLLPDGIRVAIHSDDEVTKGELKLMYVAATRAKKRLTINTSVIQALNLAREKLERLVHSSEIDDKTLCLQCGFVCMTEERKKKSPPLVTKVNTLPLSSDGLLFKGGFICDSCASLKLFEMTQNPMRLLNPFSQEYVRDFERMARLPFITGTEDSVPPDGYNPDLVPIRWDKYRLNR